MFCTIYRHVSCTVFTFLYTYIFFIIYRYLSFGSTPRGSCGRCGTRWSIFTILILRSTIFGYRWSLFIRKIAIYSKFVPPNLILILKKPGNRKIVNFRNRFIRSYSNSGFYRNLKKKTTSSNVNLHTEISAARIFIWSTINGYWMPKKFEIFYKPK